MRITTLDSLRFLGNIIKPGLPKSSGEVFTDSVCSATLFRSGIKKHKGLVVAFHGLNQMGNEDDRMEHLAHCFNQIGYDCLMPKLNAFTQVRLPVDADIKELVEFFNGLLNHQISTYDNLSFIGPSTACLYMMKLGTHAELQVTVNSFCFISPYYDSYMSTKDLLETPKNLYAQLITLKILCYTENTLQIRKHTPVELEFMNKLAAFCFEHNDDPDVLAKVLKKVDTECPGNTRLIQLISNLGNPGLIDEELEPAILEMAKLGDYSNCLDIFNSKLTLIHGYNDNIYASANSHMLTADLKQKQIRYKFHVTKLLSHTSLVPGQLIKECYHLVKMLNFFLNEKA